MTGSEVTSFIDSMAQQVGVPRDSLMQAIPFWHKNLIAIPLETATEGLKVLLIQGGPSGKDAGKWIAAVVRYCGGSAGTNRMSPNGEAKEPEGCHRCLYSGTIEVPSHKDWDGELWRGIYTMTVACVDCGLGQMRACQMKNIRWYEQLYPQWKREYPLRMHERRLRDLLGRAVPTDREWAQMHKSKIAWLQSQLGEVV